MDEIVTAFKAALDKLNADSAILQNAEGTLASAQSAVTSAKKTVGDDLTTLQTKFDELIAAAEKSGLVVHDPLVTPSAP